MWTPSSGEVILYDIVKLYLSASIEQVPSSSSSSWRWSQRLLSKYASFVFHNKLDTKEQLMQSGREADQSLPSSAEVKMRVAVLPLPQYVFTAWCLFKHRILFHGVVLGYAHGLLPLPLYKYRVAYKETFPYFATTYKGWLQIMWAILTNNLCNRSHHL
jgi:hypothetical protein